MANYADRQKIVLTSVTYFHVLNSKIKPDFFFHVVHEFFDKNGCILGILLGLHFSLNP